MTRAHRSRASTSSGRSYDATVADLMSEEWQAFLASGGSQEWRAFLRSGEYARTRAFIRADGSEGQLDFTVHLEVPCERRLAIYLALAESNPGVSVDAPPRSPEQTLTNREREVVGLIALGCKTGEIAAELCVSPETVRTHVRNSMSKFGARTRAQLVAVVLSVDPAIHR